MYWQENEDGYGLTVLAVALVRSIAMLYDSGTRFGRFVAVTEFHMATGTGDRPRPEPVKARATPHAPRPASNLPGIEGALDSRHEVIWKKVL